ncbi:2-oxoacid:acceptor oxidoreductase subunit alpha [Clostridium sp. Cult2]|uniref:2-oxoacid:acceptor oxidoreductase subunit alpha n=1 Tax=Clostridium sp. Cult2 TaxID=2079003 RepID=UPI001F408D33|nr:2-oxoacid:acceptor oxidoreductase subunit alpha [Clostridium sp. Cult2]MCF6466015.1 2-oxoacid:acceptor oxidoreductase subunit alpha [Clostridium sp. Cult2]
MDYTILVGGAAGQGMDTFAHLLEKTLKRCGFYVFTYRDYMSRVRGGHNFIQTRFSDKPIFTYTEGIDLVFPLNEETAEIHSNMLNNKGVLICDEEIGKGEKVIHLPLKKILKEINNPRVYNTIGLGAIIKYFGLPINIPEELIKNLFPEKIAQINIEALRAGYEAIEERHRLELLEDDKIIINGNEALALGAMSAGCKFYCGYPMTPSTSILSYFSSKSEEMGIMVEQIEDEVAALNMVLGASYAGVRAMTGSSGGGVALMVEALSLSGIIELPVVLVNAQRSGPATGMSTRTEQGDLRFMIHAGHGEFPRMVIALRNPEDAFYQTARAFNIADKYQIPVILLTDLYLADYTQTIKPFDFSKIKIERHIFGEEKIKDEEYKPYKFTENGVSPRIIPGKIPGQVVLVDSHEHDELGHITEDPRIRTKMVNKRLKKFEGLKEEVEEPWHIGDERPENLIVCWGSTYGVVQEIIDRLRGEGISIGALIFGDIWPFPTKRLLIFGKTANRIIDIEQNATAQLDSLIREETPYESSHKILKYDGRPFNGDELYRRIKEEVLK